MDSLTLGQSFDALPPIDGEDATPHLFRRGGEWVAAYLDSARDTLVMYVGSLRTPIESASFPTPEEAVTDLHEVVRSYVDGKADCEADAPICTHCNGTCCHSCHYRGYVITQEYREASLARVFTSKAANQFFRPLRTPSPLTNTAA